MSKKILSLLLVLVMLVGCLASCSFISGLFGGDDDDVTEAPKTYTYNDAVGTLSTNWNPHTYQTSDESYPISFITSGLYSFVFNDQINVVEGKDPFTGYKIIPEMAAEMPVDVTEAIKASHPEFNIPESATSGYAYTIALNPNATWANGDKITAEDYVYSMKKLLDPQLKNYRATDYYAGDLCIAGAENYANQGQVIDLDNGSTGAYVFADLVKGDDGNYYTPAGLPVYVAVDASLAWLSGNTLADYVNAYGDAYFGMTYWSNLAAAANAETGYAPLNDNTYAWLVDIITANANWGEDESCAPYYFIYKQEYEEFDFANVGIIANPENEYEITLVFGKSLAGFNLLYNLSGNWLVYEPYYEAALKEVSDGVWFSTYNTSADTTMSYGPYNMTSFELDKSMTFERNENWYGYSDGKHKYVDPTDGKTYDMYMTDKIYCQVVPEASARKLLFLQGQLMGYGLQSDDFETYRNSDYCYVSPSETIFFFIFNGHKEAIAQREASADFDQSKNDLETLTLESFRRAVAVSFDKEALCTAVSPADAGGYGLLGNSYIYDPETGARYRDTDQAKQALCDFYSVDVSKYESLDAAVDSITGFDPVKAAELYTEAYEEALEKGYITDKDGDGKSDQIIEIFYAIGTDSEFYTKLLNYLNEKMNEVTAGTPFDGKIKFSKSSPLGNTWSDTLKAGNVDTVLGGWKGSALNPYGVTDLYVNPSYQYDAGWFDSTSITTTLTVNVAPLGEEADMQEVTMNLRQWSDALNGKTVTVAGTDYCFGDGIADVETRLTILAAIETEILGTYNYIPMLQEGSMALLSKQVYYVVEEYNSIMGRGGITYLKYNYDDAAWAEYVASQGGELAY